MVFTSSEITCKWVWTEKQSHFLPVVSVLCKSLHQISFWTLGINKTDSAFTSVLCLLGEAVNSAGNGQWHVWEGSSRKAVEGPEYQYLLRNWGIGLSVKGLCSTAYPPLSGTCVLDRRCVVGLHSGLTVNSWCKILKTLFFLLGTVMG